MLTNIDKTTILLYVLVFVNNLNALTKICDKDSPSSMPDDCPKKGNEEGLHVAALILARGSSKGVKLKNIALVGGVPLITRSLDAINEADVFDSVWVSTDHKLIAEEAFKGGAQIHYRTEETATDAATSVFAAQEFLLKHKEVDVLALIQCTSPFLKANYLKEAYEVINNKTRCAFSATRNFQLRWKEDKSGIIPLNFNPSRRPRRQDWKGELVENGMFYFAFVNLMAGGNFQDCSCKVVEIPPRDSLEVDTYYDLELANMISGVTSTSNTRSIPPLYREIFETCSPSGGPVSSSIFQALLRLTSLDTVNLERIWDLSGPSRGPITRTSVYKCLALVAWAQQGKEPSSKLLDNFSGQELPIPLIQDLAPIKTMIKNECTKDPNKLYITYAELKQLDTISVDLVPERIGIILKHSEYLVSSNRFRTTVRRRYNDFVALHELLLARFPYRLIPRLPPKKIIVSEDAHFLETRRKGLQRWMTLVARHPVVSHDVLVSYFLTDQGHDLQHKIRELFRRAPDEFTTSELASKAKELVPPETSTEFASSREQVRFICLGISKLKQIFDLGAIRNEAYAADMQDLGAQLTTLSNDPLPHSNWATGGNPVWQRIKRGFSNIANEFTSLSTRAALHSSIFEDRVLSVLSEVLDVLTAHEDMCERLKKGVVNDHLTALNKMLALKKRRMKGVIKGQDMESVDNLEQRMLEQEVAISSLESRHAFSLYCAQLETQLVHLHLTDLAAVFNELTAVNVQAHTEMADVWKHIQPTVFKFLPERANESKSNGNF